MHVDVCATECAASEQLWAGNPVSGVHISCHVSLHMLMIVVFRGCCWRGRCCCQRGPLLAQKKQVTLALPVVCPVGLIKGVGGCEARIGW